MPRRKSVEETSDREIMEKVFTPRIVRELDRELRPENQRERLRHRLNSPTQGVYLMASCESRA